MVTSRLEQEMKFGAWPGFTLPDLDGVAPGVTVAEAPTLDLDAVYVDTPDLRLVRRGVSLRRRTGEGATRWTLKLPDLSGGGPALARREFDVETDATSVPDELADLVVGWVRRSPVGPVATIRTCRHRWTVQDPDGVDLAEIADDLVSVIEDDDQVAARFREIEVELASGASPDILSLVAGALARAGAGAPDPTSKIVRALGPRALAPPDLTPPDVGAHATLAELVHAGLARSARQVIDHDHVIRLDDDIEGVHKVRVGLRRMRSDLQTFAPVLESEWAEGLRRDLRGLAGSLGVVRDTDVLLERLWAAVVHLDERDHGDAALVVRRLEQQRHAQVAALLAEMRTDHYVDLLERVAAAGERPAVTHAARVRADQALPALVRPRWRKLRRAVAALGPRPADDELHAVRILVKRTRYAVDVAVPVVGAPAERLSGALAGLQDVLGELHDTAVATAWLRGLTATLPHAQAMVAGQLIGGERRRAQELRAVWPSAWSACDRRSLVRWLR
jgi:CHAD domain-containing protein